MTYRVCYVLIKNFVVIIFSNLPLNTKLPIYKQIIHPTLTYIIQLWGRLINLTFKYFNPFDQFAFASLPMPPGMAEISPFTQTLKPKTFAHFPLTTINYFTKTHSTNPTL